MNETLGYGAIHFLRKREQAGKLCGAEVERTVRDWGNDDEEMARLLRGVVERELHRMSMAGLHRDVQI